jgi:hypothetical protein
LMIPSLREDRDGNFCLPGRPFQQHRVPAIAKTSILAAKETMA